MEIGRARYALELKLSVNELDEHERPVYSKGLEIVNRLTLGELGFMEIAKVLGQFHELARTIESERGNNA